MNIFNEYINEYIKVFYIYNYYNYIYIITILTH